MLSTLSTGNWLTLVGVLVAAIGLAFANSQLRSARHTARGQFLLSLGPPFRDFNELHVRLRGGGQWWPSEHQQPRNSDWAELEQYMGLFERMWILVRTKSLDLDVVDRLYAYRIANIVMNDHVRASKLERDPEGWSDFIRLWTALEIQRSLRARDPLCATHRPPSVSQARLSLALRVRLARKALLDGWL